MEQWNFYTSLPETEEISEEPYYTVVALIDGSSETKNDYVMLLDGNTYSEALINREKIMRSRRCCSAIIVDAANDLLVHIEEETND